MDAAAATATTNWRISLQADIRHNLVNMITETLKNCFPEFGPEGLIKLNKMAELFEKESYIDAKNKSHYLRKISWKIQNMEKIFQTTGMPNTPIQQSKFPLAPGSPKYFWDIMDTATDRRISLQPDNRPCHTNMIRDTLKNCFPDSGPERLAKLNKMAEWYEEESFIAAKSNSDYLRRITLKILKMENIFLTTGMRSTIQSNLAGRTQNPLAPASHGMQSQVQNQQKSQIPLPNQSQARRRIKPQHIQNTIVNAGVQSFASLPSASYVTSLSQTSLSKAVCQSDNTQSGIAQNSVGISVRQGISSNVFSNLQYLYQQPLQHQILSSSIDSEDQTFHEVMYQKPQQQQHPNNPMQPTNMQKSVSSNQSTAVTSTCHASTDSKAQKGQNADDQQEETYQKIQSMKKKYLPSLNEMYQRITVNCQQPNSLPNVPKSKRSGKEIKKSLETAMEILNASKDKTLIQKEQLATFEEVILFILSEGPQKPVSEEQQPQQQPQEAQQQQEEAQQQQQDAPQQAQKQQQEAHQQQEAQQQ